MKWSPAGVSYPPRYTRVKGFTISFATPTDDKPSPRQKGEAVAISWPWQVRDGAGGGGRAGEQFN